jgi:hypothetical protein
VDWSESGFEFQVLAEERLDDAAIVWCSDNEQAPLDAADVLGIGVGQSPQLDVEATIVQTGSDCFGSWAVRDFTTDSEQRSIWLRYHVDSVARACTTAFEARWPVTFYRSHFRCRVEERNACNVRQRLSNIDLVVDFVDAASTQCCCIT